MATKPKKGQLWPKNLNCILRCSKHSSLKSRGNMPVASLLHFCHGRKFVHQSCHLGFLINDLANSLSQALTTCLVLFKGANMSLFSAASFSSK